MQCPHTHPLLYDRTRDERDYRRACLSRPRDPPDGTGEKPLVEDAFGVVNRKGIHRSKKQTDACHSNGVPDERGDELNNEFEPDEIRL